MKKECERQIDITVRKAVKEESDSIKAKLQSLKTLQLENRKAVSQRLNELKDRVATLKKGSGDGIQEMVRRQVMESCVDMKAQLTREFEDRLRKVDTI